MAQLNTIWFNLDTEKTDLENVFDFVEQLPNNLEFLINQESFIYLLDKDENYGISFNLFFEMFIEARTVLLNELNTLKTDLRNEEASIEIVYEILNQIGFSGSSLKMKAGLLNKLWTNVATVSGNTINFVSSPVGKLLRKFLVFLNSMLASLKGLIPGMDAIKEVKDVLECYVGLNDEKINS